MKKLAICLALSTVTFFYTCTKEQPLIIIVEEEVITSLTLTLQTSTINTTPVFSFKDVDGDGGNAPTISTSTISSNTVYTGTISLFNEQVTPKSDVGKEILEEADTHQFFFKTTVPGLKVEYLDKDSKNLPLGLITRITTTQAGTGSLTITLRHSPNKTASGVASGTITNAGGETDIEVTFNVTVK